MEKTINIVNEQFDHTRKLYLHQVKLIADITVIKIVKHLLITCKSDQCKQGFCELKNHYGHDHIDFLERDRSMDGDK